jgi:hypothetical protein
MSRPLRLLLLSGWAMASVTAGAASHCQGEEREVFSCALRNGKTVSICASPALSADAGYLQYRYGRLGHVELEYPSSRTGSQARFDFESHRPYQGEYESLGFEKDGYRYSTYRVLTSEPGQKNRAGVTVYKLDADRIVPTADLLCRTPDVPQGMGLQDIIREPR